MTNPAAATGTDGATVTPLPAAKKAPAKKAAAKKAPAKQPATGHMSMSVEQRKALKRAMAEALLGIDLDGIGARHPELAGVAKAAMFDKMRIQAGYLVPADELAELAGKASK